MRYSSFFFLLFILACSIDPGTGNVNKQNNPEVYFANGLYKEKKPDSISYFDYSVDNKIYNQFNSFDYSFWYIENTDTFFFSIKEGDSDWEFTKQNEINERTILKIRLTPKPFATTFGLDYEQTIIQYDFIGKSDTIIVGGEQTGCVENFKNIWLHPTRSFLFKILEINPFPFIQAPYEVDNTWNGELKIGPYWSDPRWRVWEKSIINNYVYTIIDKVNLETEIGNISCFVTEGKATSRLGNTYLTSWFNPVEGFIRMEYININKSKIIFEKKWL